MTEAPLMNAWLRLARKTGSAVVLKHNDAYTAGIPDISFTENGHTTWLEFKVVSIIRGVPRIKWQNELQRLTALRLEKAGSCFVIAYHKDKTYVIRPSKVGDDGSFVAIIDEWGVDHSMVLRFVRNVPHGH